MVRANFETTPVHSPNHRTQAVKARHALDLKRLPSNDIAATFDRLLIAAT